MESQSESGVPPVRSRSRVAVGRAWDVCTENQQSFRTNEAIPTRTELVPVYVVSSLLMSDLCALSRYPTRRLSAPLWTLTRHGWRPRPPRVLAIEQNTGGVCDVWRMCMCVR